MPPQSTAGPAPGFFETFRSHRGLPVLWAYHERRLLAACARAGIIVPENFLVVQPELLSRRMDELRRQHGQGDGVFRYVIGRESETGAPSEQLEFRPLPPPDPDSGIELHVLKQRRDHGPWVPRPKSTDYRNTLLGAAELQSRPHGEGDDALFLDAEGGHVVEALYRNVIWVRNDRFFAPAPELGAVDGTCLQWIRAEVSEVVPARATLADLASAEAWAVCNSVRGVTPVRAIRDENGKLCAEYTQHPHPMVELLRQRWREVAGLDIS